MTGRHRTGLVLALIGALAVGAGTHAGSARGATGLLDHYEVCSKSGEYALITSISVRERVFFAERRDNVIRVITQYGDDVTTSIGTGRPGEFFREPIVGTSPTGPVYVINNPLFDPRLFKFSGRGLEREFALNQGPYEIGGRLRSPVGVFGTRLRDAPGTERVFVGDGVEGIVVFDGNGTWLETYFRAEPGNYGRLVGISGIPGAVLLAQTTDTDAPSRVSVFTAGIEGIGRYAGSIGAVEFIKGVAGAPDGTYWVLGGNPPGFAGLEHFDLKKDGVVERVPIPGGLNALSVAPDGAVWVSRGDGLLRIGSGGGPVPPDQYGRGKCGPPQVQTSVPENQQVIRSRSLVVVASCNERCAVSASARLFVPGRGSPTFKLRPAKRQLAAERRARLRLRLSRKAARAVRRAKARGRRSSVTVTLRAADAGKTKSLRQFGLKIGR